MAARPKCRAGRVLGVCFLLRLLENEGQACLQERGKRHLKQKKGAEVTVLFVEAAENRDNEGFIRDRLANVGKGVGEGLELGAVVVDCHVALGCIAEFRVNGECVAFLVVVEEAGDGVPDLSRRGSGSHDDAEELGGDRAIDPGEDHVVITRPVGGRRRVGRSSLGFAEDVVGEAVAAKGDEEQFAPLSVVGVLKI